MYYILRATRPQRLSVAMAGAASIALLLATCYFLFAPLVVAAEGDPVDITAGVKKAADATGIGELKETTLGETVGKIVRGVLGLLGIVFLVYTVYGGYVYLTAGGDEEKVKDAKNIIKHGVIGLIIMVAAFAIAEFVIDKVFQAVGVE